MTNSSEVDVGILRKGDGKEIIILGVCGALVILVLLLNSVFKVGFGSIYGSEEHVETENNFCKRNDGKLVIFLNARKFCDDGQSLREIAVTKDGVRWLR